VNLRRFRGCSVDVLWWLELGPAEPPKKGRSEERALSGGCERLVEEGHKGGGESEPVNDLADEGWPGSVHRGEDGGDAPLALQDEVESGILRKESLGGAGEGLAVDRLHDFGKAGAGDKAAKLVMTGCSGSREVAADSQELVTFGHVAASGDGDLGGVDVEVEAGSGGFFEAGARPPGSGVDFVGALVLGEADIAVDAHQGLLRGPDVLGSEGEQGLVDLSKDGEHGRLQFPFKDVAPSFKPGAVVVALEAAEKAERGCGEVGWHQG